MSKSAHFHVIVERCPRTKDVWLVRHRDGKTKLPSGRWKVFQDYRIKPGDRGRNAKGELVNGKRLAEALADKLRERHYSKDMDFIDSDTPLEELVENFLSDKEREGRSLGTIGHYRDSLKRVLKKFQRLTDLADPDKLKEWKIELKKVRSLNTVYGTFNDTNMFFNWLVREEKLSENPMPKGLVGVRQKAKPRFWTTEQFLQLDEIMAGINHYARIALHLGHDHGMRKCEMVGDKCGQWTEGALYTDLIWHKDGKVDLYIRPEITKGRKYGRKIRLSPQVVSLLGSRKSGPLVPLTYEVLGNLFDKARKLMGEDFQKRTFHGARHGFGKDYKQLIRGDSKALQDLFGHQDLETTDIYSQFEESYLDKTMDELHEARRQERALLRSGQIRAEILGNGLPNDTHLDQNLLSNHEDSRLKSESIGASPS